MPRRARAKVWNRPQRSYDVERQLAGSANVSAVTASVLASRGVVTAEQALHRLSGDGGVLHDPFLLPDMEQAVDRIHRAIREREHVCIYGDYDVDGVASTSVYVEFFRARGLDVAYRIPNRFRDGYGFTMDAVAALRDRGIALLIAADCGTTSRAEVAFATSCGIDVIITDHHEPGDTVLPDAFALLNPCRADSTYPFRGLCSGALAFKVAMAYDMKYHGSGPHGPGEFDVRTSLDLVALATIADMAPLHDENRTLVCEGLRRLSTDARVGITALKEVANVSGVCRAETVGFALAPRINAAGRMDDATIGVRLLTTSSVEEARGIARELDRLNDVRKKTQREIELDVERMLEQTADGSGPIVVSGVGWHCGVVGIVAARMAERYYCPAIVIALDEHGVGRGSARSIPEFDLFDGINRCRVHVDAFGGHQCAAGLTIREERVPAFREAFTAIVHENMAGADPAPRVDIDADVDLDAITFDVADELSALGPFGAHNPTPLLAAYHLDTRFARRIGQGHLSVTLRSDAGFTCRAVGFGMGGLLDTGMMDQGRVDAAFTVDKHYWQGEERLQLRLVDLRRSCGRPEGIVGGPRDRTCRL